MRKYIIILIVFIGTFIANTSYAVILDVGSLIHISSLRSFGLYNMVGFGTWNGQPISDTNRPSDYQNELATTFNLYLDSNNVNKLYVTVSELTTSHYGFASGAVFTNITLTGLKYGLYDLNGDPFNALPQLSNNYALAGQDILTDSGISPIDTTPGFNLFQNDDKFLIKRDPTEGDYGIFSSRFTYITGGRRIRKSGVFELMYDNTINLSNTLDYSNMEFYSRYGNDNQLILAEQTFGLERTVVPEPATMLLFGTGLAGAFIRRKKIS